MAAQTRMALDRTEELVIDVGILEAFQKLGYDCPTQEQAEAVRSFVLGSDTLMLPTGNGKSFSYASLPYIFDSLGMICWREGCSPLHCCCPPPYLFVLATYVIITFR